jgi:hypothetical protein
VSIALAIAVFTGISLAGPSAAVVRTPARGRAALVVLVAAAGRGGDDPALGRVGARPPIRLLLIAAFIVTTVLAWSCRWSGWPPCWPS